jgi:hypothetical protein
VKLHRNTEGSRKIKKMAEDLVELGIEGIDKLVDKHFHKVPDKYIDPRTYRLHRRRHRNGKGGRDEEESSASESDVAYNSRTEESYPRQSRQQNESGYGYGYLPRSPTIHGADGQDGGARRRPGGLARRSSSQPGRYRESGREKERGTKIRERRRSHSGNRRGNMGQTGSRKDNGNGKGESKTGTVALALLGIAAGGLAASAFMNAREKKREGEESSKVDHREMSGGGYRDQGAGGRRTAGGGRR